MLSKKTKYALKALVHLAKEKGKGPLLIGTIAETEHIPKKFLEAILLDLRNAGMVSSKKGKGGGYYLLLPPEEINCAEVVRLFDGAIGLLPCVSQKYYEPCAECTDEVTCGIRKVFSQVRNETFEILRQTTLSKLIDLEGVVIE